MRKNQVSEQIRSTTRRNIRPMAEAMERRELMAIDLFYSSTATTNYPGVQVSETVGVNSSLAESVALVGDVNGDGYQDFLFGNPVSNYATLIFGSNPTDYLSLSNADRATTVQQLSSTSGTVRGCRSCWRCEWRRSGRLPDRCPKCSRQQQHGRHKWDRQSLSHFRVLDDDRCTFHSGYVAGFRE